MNEIIIVTVNIIVIIGVIIISVIAGVEITTRLLAKCEWNLELASNFLNLLASLASVFSSSQ
jgi:hypothetical protein